MLNLESAHNVADRINEDERNQIPLTDSLDHHHQQIRPIFVHAGAIVIVGRWFRTPGDEQAIHFITLKQWDCNDSLGPCCRLLINIGLVPY